MANRDIDFVIRARDEASRAIDAVVASLTSLKNSEQGVEGSSEKTAAFLGGLSKALSELKNESSGFTALTKVVEDIKKAEGVLATLEQKFASNGQQLSFFASSANKAAADVGSLKTVLSTIGGFLESEKASFAALKTELAGVSKEIAAATKLMEAYPAAEEAAIKKTQALTAQQERQIATLDRLRAKMAQTTAPTSSSTDKEVQSYKNLQAAIERAETALAKTQQKLGEAKTNGEALSEANNRATASIGGFVAKQAELTAAISRSETAINGYKADISGTSAVLKTAEADVSRFGNSLSKMLSVLENDEAALTTFKTNLSGLQSEAQRGAAALNLTETSLEGIGQSAKRNAAQVKEISDALKSFGKGEKVKVDFEIPAASVANYKALIAQVRDSKATFEMARAETTRLGAEIAQSGTVTKQLATEFALAKSNAAQAQAEFMAVGSALGQFKGQAQGSFLALEKTIAALETTGSKAGTVNAQLRSTAGAIAEMSSASSRGAGAAGAFATGISSIYGESRQAMSWLQRLRGEILALGTSYAGFQGLISGFQAVVTAVRTVEAATNRLGAAFDQNFTKATQAFDSVRAESLRLGQSFQTTSNEYGKFAIAANEANFSLEATNKIFRSVAEASRVSKLSMDELKGVYLALTQMISKGKVTSEELRRQLGDRLPGAFNIMAKAVGVTTAELDKMMKEGKVLADEKTLSKFADELTKRYGAQLPQALKSTSFALDNFFNLLEQGAQRVATGGFDEALRKSLEKVNSLLNSRTGRDFFLSLGAAAGRVIEIFGTLAENAGTVAQVLGVIAAAKVGQALLAMAANAIRSAAGLNEVAVASERVNVTQGITAGLVFRTATGFTSLGAATLATGARLTAFATEVRSIGLTLSGVAGQTNILTRSMAAISGVFTGAGAAITRAKTQYSAFALTLGSVGIQSAAARIGVMALTPVTVALSGAVRLAAVSFRTLYAAMGGLPGILATVAVYFAGEWLASLAGKVDDATAAIDEHKRLIDEVNVAYGNAANKSGDWAKGLKSASLDQLNADLRKMQDLYKAGQKDVKDYYLSIENSAKIAGTAEKVQLDALRERFLNGTLSAGDYKKALEGVYSATQNDNIRQYMEKLLEIVRKEEERQYAIDQTKEAIKRVSDSLKVAQVATDALGASAEKVRFDKAAADLRQLNELRQRALSLNAPLQKDGSYSEEVKQIKQLAIAFGQGKISAADFAAQVYNLESKLKSPQARKYAADLVTIGDSATKVEASMKATASSADQADAALSKIKVPSGLLSALPSRGSFGETLLSIAKYAGIAAGAMVGVGIAINALSPILGAARTGFVTLGAALSRLGPLVSVLVSGFRSIATVVGVVVGAVGAFEIAIVAAAIGIGYAIGTMIANWDSVKSAFASGWDLIEQAATSVWEGIKSAAASAWQAIVTGAQSAGQSIVSGFQSALSSVKGLFADLASAVQGYFNSIMSWLGSIISKADEAKTAVANSGGGTTTARAQGGPVYGPGTSTSDSILARLSTGEFVVKAKAVAAYGLNFLRNVNDMRYVPAYATGGAVGLANRVARMPASPSLQSQSRPFNLVLDGKTFSGLSAPSDTAENLIRFSRAREVRSGGRKPNWSSK